MALNENPTLQEIIDEVERLNNLIVDRGGSQTITPGTSNKTLNKGYYKGNITVKGDANLVASNIVSGKSIFGVNGNVTVSSLGGKKWASGEGLTDDRTDGNSIVYLEVDNLNFKPSIIIMSGWRGQLTEFGGLYCEELFGDIVYFTNCYKASSISEIQAKKISKLSNCYVNSNGFKIPSKFTNYANTSITESYRKTKWIAIE